MYSHVSAQTDPDGTHIRVYMEILDNDLSKSESRYLLSRNSRCQF